MNTYAEEHSQLVVDAGEQAGLVVPLEGPGPLTIGRGEDCDLQIMDAHMSRRHSTFARHNEGWAVRDLGSRNGTSVNGRRIDGVCALRAGDSVQVGSTVFRFEQSGGSCASSVTIKAHVELTLRDGTVAASLVMPVREPAPTPDTLPELPKATPGSDRTLAVVYDVADAINSLLEQDELLERVVEVIRGYFSPDRVAIFLRGEGDEDLRLCACRSSSGPGHELVISRSILERAVLERVAVLVADTADDDHLIAAASIREQGIRSALCAPLAVRGEVLGAIYLDRRDSQEGFDEGGLRLLTIVANQAAQVIANARLHTRLLERRAQEREIELAWDIQKGLLPGPMPRTAGVEVLGTTRPARIVGGDFYDFFFLDAHRLCFVIADVSDKGMPAALFMAVTKTLIRTTADAAAGPGELLTRVNRALSADNPRCMFVTAFIGVIETRTGELCYANAGHNPPYRLGTGSAPEEIRRLGDMPLGVMPDVQYSEGRLRLDPDDVLFMFTDGVTEAADEREALFAEEELERSLARAEDRSPSMLIERVMADVDAHAGGAPQSDDITMLVLKYAGV
jgi:phosphoserine phosphatase RsbU/P